MKAPLPFALLVAVLLAPGLAAQAPARTGSSAADVKFITGMIPHHAQAVQMGRWAPTHGASAALKRFAERIVVAQRDEIRRQDRRGSYWRVRSLLPLVDDQAPRRRHLDGG